MFYFAASGLCFMTYSQHPLMLVVVDLRARHSMQGQAYIINLAIIFEVFKAVHD